MQYFAFTGCIDFHSTYFERFALELSVNFTYVRSLLYKYGFTYVRIMYVESRPEMQVPIVVRICLVIVKQFQRANKIKESVLFKSFLFL
jgi:hypothetical protein